MPTTSVFPRPRSWDEFEDIVADIYGREWRDPHIQRNGRQGQTQHGVDVFGRPEYAGGGYVGVQCKRLDEGALSSTVIDSETIRAEGFQPTLYEFILATTDKRDAKLQQYTRKLNKQRAKDGKFQVYIVFWEDICAKLADEGNSDLIRKHYEGFIQSIGIALGGYTAITPRWREHMSTVIDEVRHQYVVVAREAVRARVDPFLVSPSRILLVLSLPGTSTSPVLLAEAERLMEQHWAALLIQGEVFTVDHMVEVLAPGGGVNARHRLLVEPWVQPSLSEPNRIVLLVDALQQQDPAVFYRELLILMDLTATVPANRLKIILSCDELAWEGLRSSFPKLRDAGESMASGDVRLPLVRVGEFGDSELKLALRQIGADELTTSAQPGALLDPHSVVLLDLLRNPSIFEVYARLRAAGSPNLINGSSRGAIVQSFLERALDEARTICRIGGLRQLRDMLVSLARLLRQEKRRDLQVEVAHIVEHLPSLRADAEDPGESPFWAFVAAGLLVVDGTRGLARFRVEAVHAELAADIIEEEVASVAGEDLNTFVGNLHDQFFGYPPLGDALLSFLDRMVLGASANLDCLVEAILRAHWLRIQVVFRLTAPQVIESLFRVAKQQEDLLHRCIAAATVVRQTDLMRKEILLRLRDPVPRIRQMAATVAGAHQIVEAIGPLLDLASVLRGGSGDAGQWRLIQAAFDSLSSIGLPAVEDLVLVAGDASMPIRRRTCALDALRTIGFRAHSISSVLTGCIEEDIPALTFTALMTAIALRDESVLVHARTVLGAPDPQIVCTAARMLEELPHIESEEPLKHALTLWSEQDATKDIVEILRAIRGALLAIADLRSGTHPSPRAHVMDSKWNRDLARSLQQDMGVDLAGAYLLLLRSLAGRVPDGSVDGTLYRDLSGLHEVLAPAHLEVLAAASKALEADGIDIVHDIVDALVKQVTIDPRDALGALVRCQSSRFDQEVVRLIAPVKWGFILDVCEALWIAGPYEAEQLLLEKWQQLPTATDTLFFEQAAILKALGTCAGTAGAALLMDYLRTAETVELYLAAESVCPLVRRGILAADTLIDLANDHTASVFGRACAIQALGILDPREHQAVFRDLAQVSEDETVLGWAVSFLQHSDDPEVPQQLRQVLTQTKSAFAAGKAAYSLAALGNQSSAVEIEAVLVDLTETGRLEEAQSDGTSNLIAALAHFAKPSSVALLQSVLKEDHHLHVQAQVVRAMGGFPDNQEARALVLDHFSGEGISALRYQASAAVALSKADPSYLVKKSLRLSKIGALEQDTRRAIANWLPMGLGQSDESLPGIDELVARLLTDRVFSVREQTADAMYGVDHGRRRKIYSDLWENGGWDRACAVQASGFWDDFIDDIGGARLDSDADVRRAAGGAMELQQRRISARYLLAQLPSDEGQVRLRAYHCIRELGDWQIARELYGLLDTGPARIHHLLDRLARETAETFEKQQEERAKTFDKS